MSAEPAAVRCEGLVYAFGDHRAVDGIDLEVHPGEMFGLLGPNGAGKTTTIRILTTLLPVAAGRRSRCSATTSPASAMAVRRLIGYVPQQLSADGRADRPRERRRCSRGCSTCPAPSARRASDRALEAIGLAEHADRLASTYSGGMVRRLELAQALVSAPAPADARRADDRARPDRPRGRVGPHRRAARADRDDRAGHHALHGRGRGTVRPGRAHAPRHAPRRRHARPS